jgi:photosystem II stability/assembly factor-like uncharacterized protein
MVCPGVSECFAVEQNSVLGTTDAGRTWSIEKGVDDAFLTSISCPTITRCIAVGSVGAADPGLDVHPMSGLIVRTDDGGKTWTSLP